jgi:hypothetical protein
LFAVTNRNITVKALEVLIEAGSDPHASDKFNQNALYWFVKSIEKPGISLENDLSVLGYLDSLKIDMN